MLTVLAANLSNFASQNTPPLKNVPGWLIEIGNQSEENRGPISVNAAITLFKRASPSHASAPKTIHALCRRLEPAWNIMHIAVRYVTISVHFSISLISSPLALLGRRACVCTSLMEPLFAGASERERETNVVFSKRAALTIFYYICTRTHGLTRDGRQAQYLHQIYFSTEKRERHDLKYVWDGSTREERIKTSRPRKKKLRERKRRQITYCIWKSVSQISQKCSRRVTKICDD